MKTKALNRMIEIFINGNLTDAKESAKRHSISKIRAALINEYGYSDNKATITAFYLKGEATFQEACDAK